MKIFKSKTEVLKCGSHYKAMKKFFPMTLLRPLPILINEACRNRWSRRPSTNQQKKLGTSRHTAIVACYNRTKNKTNISKTYEIKSRYLRQKFCHTLLPMLHFTDGIRNFVGTLTQKNKTTIIHYIYYFWGFSHALF